MALYLFSNEVSLGEVIEIKCQACDRAKEYFIGGSGIGGDLTPLFRCLACHFMETKEKEHSSITVTFECPECSASMEEIDEDEVENQIPKIKCFHCGEGLLGYRNIGWWD